jgi:hypothetical protein
MARESRIEKADVAALEAGGFQTVKCGKGGVPDRLVMIPPPSKYLAHVPSAHVWIEYKQPGGKLTPAQKRRIPKMRERGEAVLIVDFVGGGVSLATAWQRAYFLHLGPVMP